MAVGVDLEARKVDSVTVHAPPDDDEPVDLDISLDSDEEQPAGTYGLAQQIVDASSPFELSGWWAPSPEQRRVPTGEPNADDELDQDVHDAPVRLHRPPAKEIGPFPPYALAYNEVLPDSHREALTRAAIVYLDECQNALRQLGPGDSYADSPIGEYLPGRYDHHYDASCEGHTTCCRTCMRGR